ncbi:MAG: TonB-dependent receptor [Verrucomicrobia bacterium]|nr:TonB-dependent receptor [Verrucomicrobiota bacterium]
MRIKHHLLPCLRISAVAALGLLAVPAAHAQPGGIVGRIHNVVTGQYLNNARVALQGTDLVAFSDETGSYRLAAVPPGRVVLEVFYTGLDPQQIPLTVSPGAIVERDIALTSAARYGADTTVKLDSFVVTSSRDTDAVSIAVNEQRFAANIKTVVAADALGDVMDGNVGEFLKFLPGITAEYDTESGGSVASVAVRGFPTSMAVLSTDGMEMANTGNPQGASRVFQFKEVSINNISRLEVTKVPTPASPADSMSGSIDMVSKSSFERRDAQLRYSVSFAGIHDRLSLSKQPHVSDRRIYKVRPSANFDYTLPVSRNFGLVITGQVQERFVEQQRSTKVYNAAGTNTGAALDRPFLAQYQVISVPRLTARQSGALRADWRPTRSGVLSLSLERSRFVADRSNASINFTTGTNGAPTPATGTALSFGPDFTVGATGRGGVALMGSGASVVQRLDTQAASLRYRFDNGTWRLGAGFGRSHAGGGYFDTSEGRFRTLGIALTNPARVTFADVNELRPWTVQVFDNTNREVDFRDLANYRLNTAQSTPRPINDSLVNAKLDVRRSLGFLRFPAALQAGGLYRQKVREVRRQSINWTYLGPDGNATTPDSPAPYGPSHYVNQPEYFGWHSLPWVSLYKAWDSMGAQPNYWTKTPAQLVAEEQFRLNNSERLAEGVQAFYAQAELGLFHHRLKVLTGVRHEKTTARGEGVRYDPNAIWLRDPDGTFAHTPAGARLRRPEAGAAGSMEELRLTRTDRGARASRSYAGSYPSLHLTYHLRDNFLLRGAYAKTYGRPDFTNLIPNATIDETDFEDNIPDPDQIPGRITVRNTGLKPWTADNFDLSLEYYTDRGGLFSAGAFRKEISNFFGNVVKLATEADLRALDLDPRYVGWRLSTTYNLAQTARVSGLEFNIRQSLRVLGEWGRQFQAFANGTKLDLDGNQDADFGSFVPESANWGITYSRRPFTVMARWNYRGTQRGGAQPGLGADAYERVWRRLTLDLSLDYQVRPSLVLYFNSQNILNAPEIRRRFGSQTPLYARRYQEMTHGVQLTLGLKGTF